MRVLFLAIQDKDLSPSQRYRLEAYLPWLASKGVEVDYAWTLDAADLRRFYGPGYVSTKASVAARALARRVTSLLPRRPIDVVFVQREAFFLGGAWAERLASLRAPIVFDFDDSIWIRSISEANRRFAFLKNVAKFPSIMRTSARIVAGNSHLAAYARQFNDHVEVIPTCIDTERYVPTPRADDGTVVIGWSGSPSTVSHFRLVLPALRAIKEKYGPRVRFKVVGDPSFSDNALGIHGEAWRSDTEVAVLQDMDVGLMPLPDDEWSKGKCGLKGLASMAVGLPTVMSPVGVNSEIVQDGVNGFLPRNEPEWISRLSRLVEDASLRRRLGDAGRQTVIDRYSILRWRQPFLTVLEEAARSR